MSISPDGTPSPATASIRASQLGLWASALGAICAWAVLIASAMQIEPASSVQLIALLSMLGAIYIVYGYFRPNKKIALASGVLLVMIASGISAGIISNAGLRLRRPLIDAFLSRADQALGIDTPALVLAFVGHPILNEALNLSYLSAIPMIIVTALWCAIRGQANRVWEIGWGFSACILISSIISVIYPAIGNIPHSDLEGLAGHGLPAGSGTFYVAAFRSLHDGTDPILNLHQLEGVVTFPSFHMVMPLIVAWALRGSGGLSWFAVVWGVFVIVSTIPIGGHYVIDLVGGALLWVGCTVVSSNCSALSDNAASCSAGERTRNATICPA